MNDNWIEDIGQKMNGYEMDAPEVAWPEIERRVAANRKHTSRFAAWRKRTAVAASLLLIAGSTAMLLLHDDDNNAVESITSLASHDGTTVETDSNSLIKKTVSLAQIPQELRHAISTNHIEEPIEQRFVAAITPDTLNQGMAETPKETNEESTTATTPPMPERHTPATLAYADNRMPAHHNRNQSRIKASVHVAGAYNTTMPSLGSEADEDLYYDSEAAIHPGSVMLSDNQPDTPPRIEADHHRPIRIGMSVSYDIDDRWSVTTGLTYSYLRSDFTEEMRSHTQKIKQKVGYLGIPLTANYTFWSSQKLSAYVSAGGMVEKPVMAIAEESTIFNGATTDKQTRELDKSSLQLSASGAVGAEYHFTPTLGVYIEPGLSYYFDNHGSLQTIYTEKPLNLNLNLGLRLTIK